MYRGTSIIVLLFIWLLSGCATISSSPQPKGHDYALSIWKKHERKLRDLSAKLTGLWKTNVNAVSCSTESPSCSIIKKEPIPLPSSDQYIFHRSEWGYYASIDSGFFEKRYFKRNLLLTEDKNLKTCRFDFNFAEDQKTYNCLVPLEKNWYLQYSFANTALFKKGKSR